MNKRLEEIQRGECGSHILPFLWMKGEDNLTIREELDQIEACGIREICLESRPYPDFCGPRWWETMDYLVPEAKKRGLKLWILDDRKFPTGYANGGFERHPELQKVYLAERHMDIIGPCKNGAVLAENFMQPDGKLIAILACPKPDTDTLAVSGEGVIDLTDSYRDGFVYFDLPEGAYRLFILFTTQKGGGREHYMNLIDSRSVRVLLDEVYEKHYEHYAPYFGSTIAGFFSDEPELGNINGYPFDAGLGRRDVRLPWSGELEKLLRSEWKADFAQNLPALWYEMGEKTSKVRAQYMEHLTDLVYTCFSGQVGNWCSDHGVEYIGHIIEDDNAHTRLACSIGHYFKEMKGQHMAGVDVVHHQIVPGFTGKIHQWIAGDGDGEFFHYALAKLGSSASHLDPKKKNRALCEIFGNYGWAEGVSFMKWLTNHMLVRGINEFTPHAFSMTYPDRDCPPHFYARGNNPQFPAFTHLMRYMQRAAQLLTGGQPLSDAAVLYFAESEWSGKPYQLSQKPMRELMEAQIDCDIVPVQALTEKEAKVEDGCLVINGMKYRCLVLPGAACEDRAAAEFVIRAAAEGLPVYAVDQTAETDTHGEPLPEAFAKAVRPAALKELADRVRKECRTQVQVTMLPECTDGVTVGREMTGSDAADREKASAEAAKIRKGLRVYVTEQGGAKICMLFNENLAETVEAELIVSADEDGTLFASAAQYDPWSNTSVSFGLEQGKLPVHLEAGEAQFFVLEKTECSQKRLVLAEAQPQPLTWEVGRADELHYGEFEPIAVFGPGELKNMNGPEMTPTFTGFYRYDSAMTVKKEAGSRYFLKLPEGGDTAQIFVNGIDCGYQAGFPGRTDVTNALKDGENTLRIEFATTLVWKRKDGASTHLQVGGTGLLADPVLERYTAE